MMLKSCLNYEDEQNYKRNVAATLSITYLVLHKFSNGYSTLNEYIM